VLYATAKGSRSVTCITSVLLYTLFAGGDNFVRARSVSANETFVIHFLDICKRHQMAELGRGVWFLVHDLVSAAGAELNGRCAKVTGAPDSTTGRYPVRVGMPVGSVRGVSMKADNLTLLSRADLAQTLHSEHVLQSRMPLGLVELCFRLQRMLRWMLYRFARVCMPWKGKLIRAS
jgi:hypothetical protein